MRLTEERLLEVLPEIRDLENGAWRSACIRIWQEAFEDTCWEDILDAPNNLSFPEDPLVRHTRGVLAGALRMAEGIAESQKISFDRQKLLLITLLHDVCKLMELEKDGTGYRKSRIGEKYPHGYYSAYLCEKHGLPEDVVQTILSHSQFIKNVPETLEGVLMVYADLADADTVNFVHGKRLLMHECKI